MPRTAAVNSKLLERDITHIKLKINLQIQCSEKKTSVEKNDLESLVGKMKLHYKKFCKR